MVISQVVYDHTTRIALFYQRMGWQAIAFWPYGAHGCLQNERCKFPKTPRISQEL
jgi:hypothetical protein